MRRRLPTSAEYPRSQIHLRSQGEDGAEVNCETDGVQSWLASTLERPVQHHDDHVQATNRWTYSSVVRSLRAVVWPRLAAQQSGACGQSRKEVVALCSRLSAVSATL